MARRLFSRDFLSFFNKLTSPSNREGVADSEENAILGREDTNREIGLRKIAEELFDPQINRQESKRLKRSPSRLRL
jgi:hypothetical protein